MALPQAADITSAGESAAERRLLMGIASNLYLTSLALVLSNKLVATGDATLVSQIARVLPSTVEDRTQFFLAMQAIGFTTQMQNACAAMLDLQSRGRQELEFPSGPHRIFRTAKDPHVALQRLWRAAAEAGLELLSQLKPLQAHAHDSQIPLRLHLCHSRLTLAVAGALDATADELAGTLPVWIRRRRFARTQTEYKVTVWTRDRRVRAHVLDVSQGGALLAIDVGLTRGEKLQIEFRGRNMMSAIVQWTHETRAGVKFMTALDALDPLLSASAERPPASL
jgi:hypothetical protein